MSATVTLERSRVDDDLQLYEAELSVPIEVAEALGSLSIHDPSYQILDTVNFVNTHYGDDLDADSAMNRLSEEAVACHELAIAAVRNEIATRGSYSGSVVMPGAAYAPKILGEGPGYLMAQTLKAMGLEFDPIVEKRGYIDESARRLGDDVNITALRIVPRAISSYQQQLSTL